MSLYGMMRTGVSGMAAQANRLSTVSDNIANSSTTGYKRSKTEFSSLVLPSTPGSYNSGGVSTAVQTAVSAQGVLQYTQSTTDLAVSGNGFFVVQDANGQPFLTRAGSFVPDGDGNLVNAAGYTLMGYSYANGIPAATANGYDGMEAVNINQSGLVTAPSANGYLSTNLPKNAPEVTGMTAGANDATSEYSAKTSLVSYDSTGGQKLLDVYYTKTGANTWEVAVFDRAEATAGTSFPYGSGPIATETLTFDPATGKLDGGSPTSIDIDIPDGETMTLDLSETSELSADFTVFGADVDGNPPNSIDSVEIAGDGTVYAQYDDGSFRALYRVPLADVPSPDNLSQHSGNVYTVSAESGDVEIGFAGKGGMGEMVSGALENSNVDIAQELTDMIQAQRSYTANSKAFQTGSELMDLLVNLKR